MHRDLHVYNYTISEILVNVCVCVRAYLLVEHMCIVHY